MTGVQVGRVILNISADVFEAGDRKGTIIDSGTTLAYLPELIYEPLVTMVRDNFRAPSISELYYKCEMTIFDSVDSVLVDTLTATQFGSSNHSWRI